MVNYSNGKIYKLVPLSGLGKCYIGSTCKKYLSQRLADHRAGYRCWKKGKGSRVTSFELFEEHGVDNVKIVLLETVDCTSVDELRTREAHWVKELDCVNRCVPNRTSIDWHNDNRDRQIKKMRAYYSNNKETLLEKNKQRRMRNIDGAREKARDRHQTEHYKEWRRSYDAKNKDRKRADDKRYRDRHKEAIRDRQKKYRDQNADKIATRRKERVHCECGCCVTRAGLSAHRRSDKHKTNMTSHDN